MLQLITKIAIITGINDATVQDLTDKLDGVYEPIHEVLAEGVDMTLAKGHIKVFSENVTLDIFTGSFMKIQFVCNGARYGFSERDTTTKLVDILVDIAELAEECGFSIEEYGPQILELVSESA